MASPNGYGPNDKGCNGWYTGSAVPEMQCRGSADSHTGYGIVLRNGTWNGSSGFGWQKAYYYHNLWTRPIIDTIAEGAISGAPNDKNYTVAYYDGAIVDEIVVVVADAEDHYWGGQYTEDGREVGVLTGYCDSGAGALQPECPGWVDETL